MDDKMIEFAFDTEGIGNELGAGAYMPALRRTKVGEFIIEDAIGLEGLTAEKIHEACRV